MPQGIITEQEVDSRLFLLYNSMMSKIIRTITKSFSKLYGSVMYLGWVLYLFCVLILSAFLIFSAILANMFPTYYSYLYTVLCVCDFCLCFLCWFFLFVFILCPDLPVSLDCPLLIAASVFPNVFICYRQFLSWYFSLVGVCFMYHLKWMGGVWAWFSLFYIC